MLGSRYFAIVPVFKAFLLVALGIISTVSASAQSTSAPSAQPEQKKFTYEIISITPGKPGVEGMGWRTASNGLFFNNVPLSLLMRMAYNIVADDQLSGLPGWARSDRYDVQAKMGEETIAALSKLTPEERDRQKQNMVEALLAERCGLKVHRETKQLPVYHLVVAKGGLKMKEATASSGGRYMTSNGKFDAQSTAIDALISRLSSSIGHLVIDKTELDDKKFDFTLKWTPDEQQGAADAGPSLYTALEEQLGLKLVAARAPVEVIVVDQMEKPSPN